MPRCNAASCFRKMCSKRARPLFADALQLGDLLLQAVAETDTHALRSLGSGKPSLANAARVPATLRSLSLGGIQMARRPNQINGAKRVNEPQLTKCAIPK